MYTERSPLTRSRGFLAVLILGIAAVVLPAPAPANASLKSCVLERLRAHFPGYSRKAPALTEQQVSILGGRIGRPGDGPTSMERYSIWGDAVSADERILIMRDKDLDPFLYNWLENARGQYAANDSDLTKAEKLTAFVRKSFERTRKNWRHPVANLQYRNLSTPELLGAGGLGMADGRISKLGDFLNIKAGVCRHQSLALVLALREAGIDAELGGGIVRAFSNGQEISGGGHQWVEFVSRGKRYLVDSAMVSIRPTEIPMMPEKLIDAELMKRKAKVTFRKYGEVSVEYLNTAFTNMFSREWRPIAASDLGELGARQTGKPLANASAVAQRKVQDSVSDGSRSLFQRAKGYFSAEARLERKIDAAATRFLNGGNGRIDAWSELEKTMSTLSERELPVIQRTIQRVAMDLSPESLSALVADSRIPKRSLFRAMYEAAAARGGSDVLQHVGYAQSKMGPWDKAALNELLDQLKPGRSAQDRLYAFAALQGLVHNRFIKGFDHIERGASGYWSSHFFEIEPERVSQIDPSMLGQVTAALEKLAHDPEVGDLAQVNLALLQIPTAYDFSRPLQLNNVSLASLEKAKATRQYTGHFTKDFELAITAVKGR